jgi:beta-lactamase class A
MVILGLLLPQVSIAKRPNKNQVRVKAKSSLRMSPSTKARKLCQAPLPLKTKNSKLQKALIGELYDAGWKKKIDKEQLAVALVDYSNPKRIYYAGVNDNKMMYAASLPKIAILLTVIHSVHKKKLQWSHKFDRKLQNMIVASSNSDASWAADLVGLGGIEKMMRRQGYCFYDDTHGGLWLGRAYRRGGPANRDPLFNISHGASARQAARFYGLLHQGKLVNRHWSFRMLGLMSPPKHHHKFVGALRKRDGLQFLARKSGTWRTFHADSALVRAPGRLYVLIGLTDSSKGEGMMRNLARRIDDLIKVGRHRRRG